MALTEFSHIGRDAFVKKHYKNFTNASRHSDPSFTAGETGLEKRSSMFKVIHHTNDIMG